MSVISLEEWRKRLEGTSTSRSPLRQNTASDQTGEIPIDPDELKPLAEIAAVLTQARQSPFTTKSDFARVAANPISFAACEGLISTKINEDTFTNRWMITSEGIDWLEGYNEVFGPRR